MPRVLLATIRDELDCACADGVSFNIIWNALTKEYKAKDVNFGCDGNTIDFAMYCDVSLSWRFDISISGCNYSETDVAHNGEDCEPFWAETVILQLTDCCGSPPAPEISIIVTE